MRIISVVLAALALLSVAVSADQTFTITTSCNGWEVDGATCAQTPAAIYVSAGEQITLHCNHLVVTGGVPDYSLCVSKQQGSFDDYGGVTNNCDDTENVDVDTIFTVDPAITQFWFINTNWGISVEVNVLPPSSTAEMAPSSSADDVAPSSSAEDMAPSSSAEDVAPSSSADDVAPSSSAEEVVPPSSTADAMAPSSSADDVVAPSSSAEDAVAPSSSADDVAALSSSAEDVPTDSSSAEVAVPPSSSAAAAGGSPSSSAAAAPAGGDSSSAEDQPAGDASSSADGGGSGGTAVDALSSTADDTNGTFPDSGGWSSSTGYEFGAAPRAASAGSTAAVVLAAVSVVATAIVTRF